MALLYDFLLRQEHRSLQVYWHNMAAVHPGSSVLVTGVNGHVASTVALRMLQMGYKIRGTVRKVTRASYVEKEFAPFGFSVECGDKETRLFYAILLILSADYEEQYVLQFCE